MGGHGKFLMIMASSLLLSGKQHGLLSVIIMN